MYNTRSISLFLAFLFILSSLSCNTVKQGTALANLTEKQISVETLLNWKQLGKGKVSMAIANQLSITETEDSQGVMLMSPDTYSEDVIVRYKFLALNAATVFVTMLSASDGSGGGGLRIPSDYQGGFALLTEKSNYFFAFKNDVHAAKPYLAKNPASSISATAQKTDQMLPGIYYDIETGKSGNQVWLKINGRTIVKMEDPNPLSGGRILFRLRGTAGIPAAALIRDVRIVSK